MKENFAEYDGKRQINDGISISYACTGCTDVTVLVKEVEVLKQMVEDMMGKVTRMRFEDKGEETESRVTKTGANQERERRQRETLGHRRRSQESRTRERLGQKRGRRYVLGATLMATRAYTRNPGDRFTAMGHTRLQGITRRE